MTILRESKGDGYKKELDQKSYTQFKIKINVDMMFTFLYSIDISVGPKRRRNSFISFQIVLSMFYWGFNDLFQPNKICQPTYQLIST